MAGNSYGTLFRITTFGESHGEALGGIIDGCPSGIAIDLEAIQLEMSRRKPGQSAIVTQRKEPDDVQFLSGIFEGQMLPDIKINAYVSSVGPIFLEKPYQDLDFSKTENNPVRCPDEESAVIMEEYIREIRKQGDTVGGTVTCVIQNVPIGLGEPVFDKLHAELGKAMLSINAVKGFEYGSGFCGAQMKGSEHNDLYNSDGTTKTNLSGGIQGGISNGMDIYFRVAFKPVATIMQKQESLDNQGNITEMTGKGRHDPCVVPRAVPIIEAMAAIVLADFYLINKTY